MMETVILYQYERCSTCKKAVNYLESKKIPFQSISIVDQPPTTKELKQMLTHYEGAIRRLFNTSGILYREQNIKDRLPALSKKEALDLLQTNGKLVKRPFLLTKNAGLVGFKEKEWDALFQSLSTTSSK